MNRIHQVDPATTVGKAEQLFQGVKKALGFVPNLMRVFGNSPTALEAYLGFSGTLTRGVLPAAIREQIALTVSEINGCEYCLSAHTLLGSKAGLSAEAAQAARRASSGDDKSDAVLKLARAITLQRGHLSDADLQAARVAGITDAELVEVVQHVALNVLTNYTNNLARTVNDFPAVAPLEESAAVASATQEA